MLLVDVQALFNRHVGQHEPHVFFEDEAVLVEVVAREISTGCTYMSKVSLSLVSRLE